MGKTRPRHERGPPSYERQLITDDEEIDKKNVKKDGEEPTRVRSVSRRATRDHTRHTEKYLLA